MADDQHLLVGELQDQLEPENPAEKDSDIADRRAAELKGQLKSKLSAASTAEH